MFENISCIEFWAKAADYLVHPGSVIQKQCTRLIAGVSRFAHCATVAKNVQCIAS